MKSKERNIKEIVLEAEALSKATASAQLTTALRWVERQTHTRTNHAQMLVGKDEGLFLNAFVKCVNAKRVLEIGTFTGYSLICLADAVLHNSKLFKQTSNSENHSVPNEIKICKLQDDRALEGDEFFVDALEINQELEYIIAEGLQRAKVEEITRVSFGDARDLLQQIAKERTAAKESRNYSNEEKYEQGKNEEDKCGREKCGREKYDVVFIDANKREYAEYYNIVFPLVKVGGYILADNVLWYGKVNCRDKKTAGIIEFNSLVENDTRVSKMLYKIRDGLYIIRKERD
ncbi:MAG: class I SAM-dependent methyltransferase [Bacteroidales bacterium]|nr:class I SAM-dependent methyltransferase [Bacteroidales bacterium]